MPLDTDKIDDAALALLYLTLHDGAGPGRGSIGMYSVAYTTRT